jgi:hypothetical protein
MDMNIDSRREDKKTCAIDLPVCRCPGTDMRYPTVLDRDICPAPIRDLDICKHEGGAAFHADMIGT